MRFAAATRGCSSLGSDRSLKTACGKDCAGFPGCPDCYDKVMADVEADRPPRGHIAKSWKLGGKDWAAWCGSVVSFDADDRGIRRTATCDDCCRLYDAHEKRLREARP